MTKEEIKEIVEDTVSDITGLDHFELTDTLEQLQFDSLDKAKFTIQLEQDLEIVIGDEVVRGWTTVQSIIDSLLPLTETK